MSFITWQYFLFLPLIVALYWLLPARGRLFLLLAASYFFYAWWDVRFLALVLATTVIDYVCGRSIGGLGLRAVWVLFLALLPGAWIGGCALAWPAATVPSWLIAGSTGLGLLFFAAHEGIRRWGGEKRPRYFLLLSIVFCLSILGFFKYFGFFTDSARALLGLMGLESNRVLLQIILPVGISFYTFQSLGYVIDVYRGQCPACADFLTFATFDAFFPQMVSGPIERGHHLIPQLPPTAGFTGEDLHEGVGLILVGLFKKVFVADNCALLANYVFDPATKLNGYWAVIGVVAFAFQIYGDFSGYTDIARGSARLLGVRLAQNFRFPYFSRNPSEFWGRWHISLSNWFRDYLYIPLGGNRGDRWQTLRNLGLTMLLAGLWHGAGWIFVLWGAYHGALLILYRVLPGLDFAQVRDDNMSWRQVPAMVLMWLLVLVGWAIFRSPNLPHLGAWFAALAHWDPTLALPWVKSGYWLMLHTLPLVLLQLATWRQRDEADLRRLPWAVRGLVYAIIVLAVVSSTEADKEFIYFQF